MKPKIKRWFGILLSLALVLVLAPGMGLTAQAAPYTGAASVTYNVTQIMTGSNTPYQRTGTQAKASLPAVCTFGEIVASDSFNWDDGTLGKR